MKDTKDAHAVAWIVYEQLLLRINDMAGDDDATTRRLIAERNRFLHSKRFGSYYLGTHGRSSNHCLRRGASRPAERGQAAIAAGPTA
eukprot:5312757-Pyramimonas_sp.AAC.1